MKQTINIGSKTAGDGHPAYIIAELSANHGHSIEVAEKTILAAAECGVDAVKLQTYTADTLTINCDNEYFRIGHGTLWDGRTLYDLYQEAYTPWEWHERLQKVAHDAGIELFSTPFDHSAVEYLKKLNMPAYKIASFEIRDVALIKDAAATGKPVIISTGVADEADIRDAVAVCRRAGNDNIILMKCTSAYPAPLEEANLATIPDMRKRFRTLAGLSDHTEGWMAPVVAVTLGGCMVEKHFILDRSIGGPDAAFSMTPADMKQLVASVRQAETAIGAVTYTLTEKVKGNMQFARSIFVVEDVAAGERFTEKNVRVIRPGYGMHPKHLKAVLGKEASCNIKKGTPFVCALAVGMCDYTE